MRTTERGFSLIELMIVVAIVALLAAIALPNYRQHVIRSHRTDATSALLRLAATEEKFYIQNNRYGTFAEIGSPETENGWYTLAVSDADAATFTATATVADGSGQEDDPHCKVFSINAAGQKLATDPGDADSTDQCW
jgi:type IV pilus assembly protein PilE